MDEAIARTTHRESKDASSSHITGSNTFSPNMCPFPNAGSLKDMLFSSPTSISSGPSKQQKSLGGVITLTAEEILAKACSSDGSAL